MTGSRPARGQNRLHGNGETSNSSFHAADSALEAVLYETVRLFHRLRVVMEQIHQQGELSSGKSGVLKELDRFGPRTVPAMARARPVSRQYIQTLVNGLLAEGLLELLENPAHKRSSLVALTEKGRQAVVQMRLREVEALEALDLDLKEEDLVRVEQVLKALRQGFESPRWKHRIQAQNVPAKNV